MRSRLASLALTLGVVATGGALAALGAYLTNHAADQPALYAVLVLLVREASKYVDALDWTRRVRSRGAPTSAAGSTWTRPPAPGAAPGLGSEPGVVTPAPPAASPEGPA